MEPLVLYLYRRYGREAVTVVDGARLTVSLRSTDPELPLGSRQFQLSIVGDVVTMLGAPGLPPPIVAALSASLRTMSATMAV